MINKIEILSVNYNTPDLIERMINSIRQHEGDYSIRIIDGSDREPFKTQIKELCAGFDNVVLQQQGWNIHHGRGMDLGVTTSKYEWCLIIDSDNYILQPIIGKMFSATQNNKKIVAEYCHVNNNGIGCGRHYLLSQPIKYFHPSLFLLNTKYYQELKNIGITFIHHGAPCIRIMEYLFNNGLLDIICEDVFEYYGISDNEIGKYKNRNSRGTVSRFGYQLDSNPHILL